MRRLPPILPLCLVLLFQAALPGTVRARSDLIAGPGQAATPIITFADMGMKDVTVRLNYEQIFVDFHVSGALNFDRATLRLHMQHSPDLLPEESDIVIALNDEPVASVILDPESASDRTMEFDLPLAALRPGENELLLRLSLRLLDNGCGDVNDPDLWATIFSDSAIAFEGQQVPLAADLSQFASLFPSFAAVPGTPQLSIILPPEPTEAELSVAAQVAAALGQAAGWESPPIWAYRADQVEGARMASDSLIAISAGSENRVAGAHPAGLTMLASPYDPQQLLLVISGADDEELQRAASALTTRSARTALQGTHDDPGEQAAQTLPQRPTRASLADRGLRTLRVRGIGPHDLYYPIDVPYNWKPTSEASAEVHFTHGPALGAASLMTAYINGFETASLRLDFSNDDDGRLIIQLSPRQIHPGRNWLHLVFDLHMPRENCKYRYFEEAWAEVSAEKSVLNLAHVVSTAPLDLQYLPSQLLVPEDLSADVFVLPAAPTSTELTAMVRIAAKLGTYSDSDALRIRATTADRYSPGGEPANVIAIGTTENNRLLGEYDTRLPQPLALFEGRVQPYGGRPVLAEESAGEAAYLEVLPSPWSRFDTLLVLSARQPDLLTRLVDLLPTGGRRLRYEGSVLVVTATQAEGFTFGNLSGESLSSSNRMLVAAILVGTFVLLGVGGFFVYFRRRGSGNR